MGDTIKGNFTSQSAFDLPLAQHECREWIEAVTGTKFASDDFQASLKNGILLCKLINQIKPGIVPKINTVSGEFAQRENISFFIKAAKQLGLRDTQLIDTSDLYESKRIRNLTISLYWLGRAARAIPSYKGPQLNLLAFQKMNCSSCKKPINDKNYLATMTQQWHTACAVCCQCHCNLDPSKPFYMEGNNIWCPNCMVGATKIGSGSPSSSHGKGHNHGHDNECISCHGSLKDGYVPDEQDESKKYCTKCICDLCHNPLIGNFNIVNGQKICNDCSCSSCGVPLKDGFFEEGISRYCGPCNDNRNKQNKSSSSSPSSSSPSHGHGHSHGHSHGPTSTTSTNSPSKQSNGCKVCDKPLTNKPKQGNDRDKFCPPHEKERCCGGCDKEIVGQSLEAFDKAYHPQCFACDKCKKVIKPGETLKKSPQGNPRCGPCSTPSSSPQCRSCDKKLVGQYVEIENEPYCEPCADELDKHTARHGGGGGQLPQQGMITSGWAPTDRCAGCSKALQGQVAKVYDLFWHAGCFKCQDCKCSLTSGYYPHDRKPYCKNCSDRIQASSSDKCQKCSKPIIAGNIIKAGGKSFHKECFSCTTCNKVIGDGTTFTRFSKPYCSTCFQKEKAICTKCRNQIQGDVVETNDGKMYCQKCAPAPTTTTIYTGERIRGFTVDPRSGKKTFH